MWYAYYGETLTSASAFESRMDGLCRELGCRGRADALVAAGASEAADRQGVQPAEPELDQDAVADNGIESELRAEL